MPNKVRKRGWIVIESMPYEGLQADNEPYHVHYTKPAAEREATRIHGRDDYAIVEVYA